MSITSDGSYFEDFTVGDTLIHQRGRTITENDNHMFTSLVMNTAELHFNQHLVDREPETYFNGRRVVYGGVVLAFVVGLASEDTSENAIAELEMDNGRHTNPVFHGDTVYAESTVLEEAGLPSARCRDRQVQADWQAARRPGGGRNRALGAGQA